MSIRLRLIIICIIITILPSIPITFLVRNLLEKSFNVGLSTTVSDALDGGMSASRKLLVRLESDFEEDVQEITAVIPSRHLESSQVDAAIKQYIESKRINGYFIASPEKSPEQVGHLPEALDAFADDATQRCCRSRPVLRCDFALGTIQRPAAYTE